MDYEKKLKEALVNGNADYEVTRWIEQTFPELKESEDERIRGKIIATIHLYYGEPLEDEAKEMIAWLEKQGEQKPVFEMKTPEESLGIDSDTYNKIVDECIYGEQKPANADLKDIVDKEANAIWKEINTGGSHSVIDSFNQFYGICMQVAEAAIDYRKPAWSEEDEKMLKRSIKLFNEFGGDRESGAYTLQEMDCRNCADWLKSFKDRVKLQPVEWSEEDDSHICNIINWLDVCKAYNQDAESIKLISQHIAWLKSLRLQNKYTYNPYKAVVESIAAMVEKYAPFDSNLQDFYDNVKVKCKDAKEYDSLYPQSHWKPSDEQMWALSTTIANILESASNACKKTAEGLLEQLKKLREE